MIKKSGILRIYDSILLLQFMFHFGSHADSAVTLPLWECTTQRCSVHSCYALYQGARCIANGQHKKHQG